MGVLTDIFVPQLVHQVNFTFELLEDLLRHFLHFQNFNRHLLTTILTAILTKTPVDTNTNLRCL
jgi:hypothetical protein